MATIVIEIEGISISYPKGGVWHVIFPVDDKKCHKINFSYKKENGNVVDRGPLADATVIEITASGATSATGADNDYNTDVYNLTSADTHSKVRMKADPKRFALMTIPNAQMSVLRYLGGTQTPYIWEFGKPGTMKPIPAPAQHIKATITLNDNGNDAGQIFMRTDIGVNLTTDAGASYTLTFNNDCEDVKHGRNDMDMYYDVIEEYNATTGDSIDKRFHIGGVGHPTVAIMGKNLRIDKDPPDLAQGKICLDAKVTDAESIANLP